MRKFNNSLIWLIHNTSFFRNLLPYFLFLLPWELGKHYDIIYENQNIALNLFLKFGLILVGFLLIGLTILINLNLDDYVGSLEKYIYELENKKANHYEEKIVDNKIKIREKGDQKINASSFKKLYLEIENLNLTNKEIDLLSDKLNKKNIAKLIESSLITNESQNKDKVEDEKELISNVIDNLNEIFISSKDLENLIHKQSKEYDRLFPKINADDLLENYLKNQDTGLEGELFVLKYERNELIKKNRSDLAIKVEHVSLINDSIGYDILSFDEFGNKKYIEVKSSVSNYKSNFFLTDNEMKTINRLENYYIYRVFNIKKDVIKKDLYIINCNSDLIKFFTIKPSQFKVTPRKKT